MAKKLVQIRAGANLKFTQNPKVKWFLAADCVAGFFNTVIFSFNWWLVAHVGDFNLSERMFLTAMHLSTIRLNLT